jgi:eukaryotic-like serine/threonine-protein kinase
VDDGGEGIVMGLERYRLLTQLGAGVDGVSYRALAPDDGRPVEVRDLSGARAEAERWPHLAKRLRLAAALEHPASVLVRELDLEHHPPYLVMEWAEPTGPFGAPDGGPILTGPDALVVVRDLADALAEAHRLGLVHGRLGPRCLQGAGGRPKVDFTGTETRPGLGRGSLRDVEASCRAPEVREGEPPDRATDIYSFGALLVWLLTGRPARPGSDARATDAGPPALIDGLLRDMLADDPAERPSAHAVARRLAQLLVPGDVPACRPSTTIAPVADDEGAEALETVDAPRRPEPLAPRWPRERLGRFRLLEPLGAGGMGAVYRAEDTSDGTVVAIKVIRPEWTTHPLALCRFRREARLLRLANNPYMVNLLEENVDEGVLYLVLEFVAGRSLGRWLAERGRLDEPTALAIMADVARALVEAHARGIVHRDIKPDNILLIESPPVPTVPGATPPPDQGSSRPAPRVKLSDFGLARPMLESESLALTEPGAIVGTPQYMAPEQCSGGAIDPRTDVYALGATLFHLLAGIPPFSGGSLHEIIPKICHDPPPPLSKFNPAVSDGVCQVVNKALAKRPEQRYAGAAEWLRDLEALRKGEPTSIAVHPKLPPHDPRELLQFDFQWELASSPRQLWPYVSNTERLNRALGFLPIRYTTQVTPEGESRRLAEGRKAGRLEVWEEPPYEWIEPRRMGIVREYSLGPFRWMASVVELTPGPEGGTTLTHQLRLVPRGTVTRMGAPLGVGVLLRRHLDRVYRRIDAALSGKLGRPALVDPYEGPAVLPAVRRHRLERRLDRLGERGVDPAIVERLGDFLAHAPAQEVARIRPLALARRWDLDPDQVVAACLHGAREGLLVLLWDLLCPRCRVPSEIKGTLRAIRQHGHCDACHLDFELDFANSIEMIFRAHPEIRDVDLGTYCIGGPAHMQHVLAQVRVAPRERFELDLELPEGSYRLSGPQLSWSVDFRVQPSAPAHAWDVPLSRGPDPAWPRSLGAGRQVLALVNDRAREVLVRVARTAPRDDALTAARGASLALFRELFPDELLSPGQLISIATITFLVTDLDRASDLYEELGDAPAFRVIHEHFRLLNEAIQRAGGSLVKTVGGGVFAAFREPVGAVRVGLGLQAVLAQGESTRAMRARVGVHRGAALVATIDDRLDYFGATVNLAQRLLSFARGGELVLTRPVAADPRVAALIQARGLEGKILPADRADLSPLLLLPQPSDLPSPAGVLPSSRSDL